MLTLQVMIEYPTGSKTFNMKLGVLEANGLVQTEKMQANGGDPRRFGRGDPCQLGGGDFSTALEWIKTGIQTSNMI